LFDFISNHVTHLNINAEVASVYKVINVFDWTRPKKAL
jgi:hypothetical protein